MESAEILEISREALYILLKISMPALLITLIIGVIVSLFQALTQIQENTLTFVPKIVTLFLSLTFLTPYMISQLRLLFEHVSMRIAGG